MSYPTIEREMYCEHCTTFFTAEGRYVRCSFEDDDFDFEPEPCCPNCSRHEAIDAEDAPEDEKKREEEDFNETIQKLGEAMATAPSAMPSSSTPIMWDEEKYEEWRRKCRICNTTIATAELCALCSEGNNPFITSKYREVRP